MAITSGLGFLSGESGIDELQAASVSNAIPVHRLFTDLSLDSLAHGDIFDLDGANGLCCCLPHSISRRLNGCVLLRLRCELMVPAQTEALPTRASYGASHEDHRGENDVRVHSGFASAAERPPGRTMSARELRP